MIKFDPIQENESGLVARTKINNAFASLTSGEEGVNNLWVKVLSMLSDFDNVNSDISTLREELREQIANNLSHIDNAIENLHVYINAINGGILGFATDTTFVPDFPEDKSAIVFAAGAGTYENLLDSDGNPITIEDDDALVIFYKGANSTYWEYKTIYARISLKEIDGGNAATI